MRAISCSRHLTEDGKELHFHFVFYFYSSALWVLLPTHVAQSIVTKMRRVKRKVHFFNDGIKDKISASLCLVIKKIGKIFTINQSHLFLSLFYLPAIFIAAFFLLSPLIFRPDVNLWKARDLLPKKYSKTFYSSVRKKSLLFFPFFPAANNNRHFLSPSFFFSGRSQVAAAAASALTLSLNETSFTIDQEYSSHEHTHSSRAF